MLELLRDPKHVASIALAMIGTLLGTPLLIELVNPGLENLIARLYPENSSLVSTVIEICFYGLTFELQRQVIYAALAAILLGLATRSAGFAF